jgi:threonyl-tRNA synthetase
MVDEAVKEQEIQEEELALEAPEKGSAEELLDAHAGDVLDPMRHSAAHIMAEAVMDPLSPARSWASGRPSRTASTTTLSCRAR